MHPSLAHVAHRPWPLPEEPWSMAMSWHDLLFAHWPVEPGLVQSLLPDGLSVDVFDGAAWIGVVPFRMTGVRLRGLPAFPGPGAFVELNVRTYATAGGRAGVWFFSLDAESAIAVAAARRWFHLPYFRARMTCSADGESIRYASRRDDPAGPPAVFSGSYGPAGPLFASREGSLERWLTERYALFAARPDGTILRGDIHHEPWPLQPAHASIDANTMAAAAGIALPEAPPHLLFARRLDVVAWAPVPA